MTISVVGQYPKFRAWDPQTKLPLVGGKLYCYAPGTTTNKAIYTTYARSIEAANPVILDANGEGLFYLDGIYDLALFDSNDVPVWTVANYNDQAASSSSSTTAPAVEGSPTNPSFEYEGTTAGLPANWTIFKWNTVVLDDAVSFSGTNSLKFVSPGGAPGVSGGGTATSDKFITRPGSDMSIGLTLKSSAVGVHNQVQLLEYNSADALQATTTIYDDTTTNPATFTTFWKSVVLGATTAWAKIYIVGAKNDSSTAGTTWVDSIEVKQGDVGGVLNLINGVDSGVIEVTAGGLRITSVDFTVDSSDQNTQTSVTAIFSASTTLNVLAGTALVVQGNTVAINGLTSAVVTTPTLTINASTSLIISTAALSVTASTAITVVSPLITTVLGLVIGAATGGAKGNGTVNAVGLYNNGSLVLANGSQTLATTLTLLGSSGLVLGVPAGGDKGANTINTAGLIYQQNKVVITGGTNVSVVAAVQIGTPSGGDTGAGSVNAQAFYDDGSLVIHNGTNVLTSSLDFTGTQAVSNSSLMYVYTNRAVVASVAASATTQVVAHGTVNSSGTLVAGQGFTAVRNSLSNYTITWTAAFSAAPAVVVTMDGTTGTGMFYLTSSTTNAVIHFTDNSGVTPIDSGFYVVAIGNK